MALDDILKDIEERKVANPPVRRNVYVADLNMNVNTDLETPDEINYATKTQVLNKPKQEYMGLKECENPFKSVFNASVDSMKNVLDKVVPESIRKPAKEWATGAVATGVSLGNLSWGATKIFSSEFAMGSETLKQQRELEQSYMRREINQEEYSAKLKALLSKREQENSLMREDIAQEVKANNDEVNKWIADMGFGPNNDSKASKFFYNLGSANVSMLASLGAFALTKNPMLSIALLSTPEFTSGYLQAIEEGKSADEAMKSGAENFFWTAGTEYIGTKVLFSTLSKSSKLNEGAKRIFANSPRISMTAVAGVEEGTQEALQSVGTDLIYKFNDISDLKAIDIIKNASNDFLFAFLSGAMIGGVTSNIQYDRIVKDTKNKLVSLKDSKGQNLYTPEQAEQVAKETARLAMSNDIIEEVTGVSRNERDNSLSKEARSPKTMKQEIEDNLKKMEVALPEIKKELMDIKTKVKDNVSGLGLDNEQAEMVAEMTQARAMMYYNAFGITPLQFYYLNELEITVDENSNILSNGRETGYTVRFNEEKVSQAISSGNISNIIQNIRTKENLDKFGDFVNKLVNEGRLTQEQRSMIYSQLADRMNEIPTVAQVVDRVREEEVDKFNQPAYHGTPHRFEEFSTDKIGTGEGAQAHGWGLYFAANRGVSERYRRVLSEGDEEVLIDGKEPDVEIKPYLYRKAYLPKEALKKEIKNQIEETEAKIKEDKAVTLVEQSIIEKLKNNINKKVEDIKFDDEEKILVDGAISDIEHTALFGGKNEEYRKERNTISFTMHLLDYMEHAYERDSKVLKNNESFVEKLKKVDTDKIEIKKLGQTFKVDIPEKDVLLDEDKTFDEQPKKVQEAIEEIMKDDEDGKLYNDLLDTNTYDEDEYVDRSLYLGALDGIFKEGDIGDTGKEIYKGLVVAIQDKYGITEDKAQKEASLILNKYGIKGITYDGEQDGRAYVIFDDKAVKVLEKFYQGERGEAIPRDINTPVTEQTKSIIRVLQSGDKSTIIHEMAHIFLRDIEVIENQGGVQDEQFKKIKNTLDKWLGKKEGQKYTREQQEKFASGFETYMATGQAPKPELKSVFDYFKNWMSQIYNGIKNMIPITPEVKTMFDEILTLQPTNNAMQTQTEGGNGGGGNIVNTPQTQEGGDIVPVTPDAKDLGKVERKKNTSIIDFTNKFIQPVTTRLGAIDVRLEYEMKMFEARLAMRQTKYKNASLDFLKETDDLQKKNKQDYLNFDRALKNRDINTINRITEKYPKLKTAYEKVRTMLDDIKADLMIYGVGSLENYFPRKIANIDGLISYLEGTENWSEIERAMKQSDKNYKSWSEEKKAEFVASYLQGYRAGVKTSSAHTKQRKIDTINDEMDRYYENSNNALLEYINSISNFIETAKMLKLGKDKVFEMGGITKDGIIDMKQVVNNIESVLGTYVKDLVKNKTITREQEREIAQILKARFNFQNTNNLVSVIKSIGYLTTLGNINSVITQFGDLTYSINNAGVFGTLKAIFGDKKIKMQDIGIDHPAEDFADGIGFTQKLLNAVLTSIGFKYVDSLGKNTYIATTFMKYKKMVENDEKKAFDDISRRYGEDFAKDLIDDIKNNRLSENVYLFAHSELSRVQPISLSEVPTEYLTHPVGRVFYSLKTFWIKQFNRVITDNKRLIQEGIKEKNADKVKEGATSMARLILLFVILGAGTDMLKDLIYLRKIDLEDTILDNFLKILGISRYTMYKGREEGYGRVLLDTIFTVPVVQMLDSFLTELGRAGKGKMKLKDLRIASNIPIIGNPYYWWLGGGRTKEKKKNKRRVI